MLFKNKKLTLKEKKNFNRNVFNKIFLNAFLKCGSKAVAKKNYKKFFYYLCNEINFKKYSIINFINKKLYISYELRIVKFRNYTNIVPFPLTRHRRFFLNIKWLLNSVKLDKRHIPFYKKLSDEVLKLIKNEESFTKKTHSNLEASILKYKTNVHYRWG